MNTYNTSLIYKLVLNDEVYYGSTHRTLNRRFSGHKYDYKQWKKGNSGIKPCESISLFKKDFDAVKIELVENVNCETRFELKTRERFYIENNPCINKRIPTRTKAESYIANREAIRKQRAAYYAANRDAINEQRAAHRAAKKPPTRR